MKTSFELEQTLYRALDVSAIKNAISGGIFLGDTRPVDSDNEDITINTITISTDACPQTATSNINIHVADVETKVNGKVHMVANRIRLKALSDKVLNQLRITQFTGMKIVPMMMSVLDEPSIHQHYANIRVDWNIQID